ncbi:hypothetical protein LOTGIDRAFT_132442 [Lottia gigantea]|uniref:G-protein coupled receptors family 1 profile domain-containing protein n=1 Tax=Lottia gigantea TaxID=225164 RepID=V3Z189_LOTGI|nr:hypothetical protein LOTGIDRAFT_132442 [Lottia gigantea]ESO84313.1 hypothetical protein LOTGIDRAFT_132442 [Lottia gigantea]
MFVGLVKLRALNLNGNKQLRIIEPGAFRDLHSLPALHLDDTAITALQANTFEGLDTLEELYFTNGSLQTVEDGAFESLILLNKLDLRNQEIETFSGGLFSGLDTLEYLYTDSYRFCCVKPASVADENCKPEADEFSSCTDLMRRETLRIFMWILGLVAVAGNFLTILYRIIFDRAGFKRGYGIFVTNLGISDFLMGIYMLIIASADALFRGRYIWNDSWWRNSPYCQLAGILTTVSSEASALFLCLITLDRFLIIKYPFGQYRFTRRSSLIGVSIVWLFSVLMGLIPILPGTGFTGRLYSRTGICLALPLTRDRTSGWQFSTGLFIFFNFVTFLLICLGQIMMYRSMVKSGAVAQSKERRNRDIEVARRLSLIVLTDFVCWFPICCMGLMTLNNVIINSEVYAWTAVFILPINSALNPLLYTISSILGKRVRIIFLKSFNRFLIHSGLLLDRICISYQLKSLGMRFCQNCPFKESGMPDS